MSKILRVSLVAVLLWVNLLVVAWAVNRADDRLDQLELDRDRMSRELRVLDGVRWERTTQIAEMVDVIDVLSEVCKADGKCEAVEASDG